MKLDMHLDVDAQSFFDCLVESVVYDVNTESNKHCKAKDLKVGFSYKKKMTTKTNAVADVKVKITDFAPPHRYSAQFKSSNDITTVSYTIEPGKNGGIDVHYEEGFESQSHFNTWNYKFVTMIYNFKAKKNMRRNLRRMQSYILSKPKDITEE